MCNLARKPKIVGSAEIEIAMFDTIEGNKGKHLSLGLVKWKGGIEPLFVVQ